MVASLINNYHQFETISAVKLMLECVALFVQYVHNCFEILNNENWIRSLLIKM